MPSPVYIANLLTKMLTLTLHAFFHQNHDQHSLLHRGVELCLLYVCFLFWKPLNNVKQCYMYIVDTEENVKTPQIYFLYFY